MVDVVEEKWNDSTSMLSGRSKVVAADCYELRIVLPSGKNQWRIEGVNASNNDRDAGVKLDFNNDAQLVRATIRSPVSREISWSIHFKH